MVRRFLRLTFDQITKELLVISGGQLARMGLGLVSSVIIARSLGSSDFGIYGVLAATTFITSTMADAGLTTTIAQRLGAVWPETPAIGRIRGRIYFWSKLGFGFLVVTAGLLGAKPLSQLIFATAVARSQLLLRLAFLGVGAIVLSGSMDGLLRATRRFRRINLVVLTNAGLTAVLSILLSASGQLTLITALVVLGAFTSLVSFVVGRLLLPAPLDLRPPERLAWTSELKPLLSFGRWIMFSNVLVAITRQLDVILVNRWHTAAATGTYFLALNLATKFEFLNHSQYTVLVPAAAKLRQTKEMLSYLNSRLKRNVAIAMLSLPLFWAIDPFVRLFYGQQFVAAISLFRWLLLIVLFDFLTLPIVLLFLPLNRPGLLATADLLQVIVFLLCAAWFIPALGPLGAVIAKGVAKFVGFAAVLVLLTALWRQSRPVP